MSEQEQMKALGRIASGCERADLVLKNGNVINVFSNRIQQADIAIQEGLIVGVGHYHGKKEIDVSGKTIAPGFIDAHLHLESTLVNPQELIREAGKKGTTTYIVDPHEAVNVSGIAGLEYYLEQTSHVQGNVYFMLPSCVPSMSFEDNGFAFTAKEMMPFVNHPRILGLGEVMDVQAVINGDEKMLEKLNLFHDKIIDGHAGDLNALEIAAYRLAGIRTDHECTNFASALMELEAGLQILIREGTAAKNLESIVKGILEAGVDTQFFSFCTDDKHIEDIETEGHISCNVRKAIQLGLSPIDAIKMATINTANCYQLKKLGAVAPGYQADLVVLNDLKSVEVDFVLHQGDVIDGSRRSTRYVGDPSLKNTIHVGTLDWSKLDIRWGHDTSGQLFPVMEMINSQILTKRVNEAVPTDSTGQFIANATYNKIAVVERHRATGKIGVGIIKGFNISQGAIATSVSHDSHNIIVVGDNDADMILAVEAVVQMQGGFGIVRNGQIVGTLPLPVMGLISEEPCKQTNQTLHDLNRQARDMGINPTMDPFSTLSFISLPVIPEIRITTNGLYDVTNQAFISLSAPSRPFQA